MKNIVVSKIVSHYRPSNDIVYEFPLACCEERKLFLTTPSFGVFYDRSFPPKEVDSLTTFPNLTEKIQQCVQFLLTKSQGVSLDEVDESNNQINKQVQLFIHLIEDLLKQGISDYHSIIPTFSALQACIKSGWRPKNISKVRS